MNLKSIKTVALIVFCIWFPLFCFFVYTEFIVPAMPYETSSPYVVMSDKDKITEDNFEPGKKAAYQHAKRYLGYAKDGSGFSAKAIRLELEALGYSEKEIAYAIDKIPEETFVQQVVKMWKNYKEQGHTLSKIDALDRWRPLGFSKKEINEAFKIIKEENN